MLFKSKRVTKYEGDYLTYSCDSKSLRMKDKLFILEARIEALEACIYKEKVKKAQENS